MPVESGDAVAPSPTQAVEVRYNLTLRDMFRASCEWSRYSRMMLVFGFLVAWGSVLGIITGDVLSFVWMLIGIAFVTGVIPGLLTVVFARQRRDLLEREMWLQADRSGIRMKAPGSSSEADWSMFRRMREMSRDILLDFGTGAATFVPKRVMTSSQLDTLRELGQSAGLLESSSSWTMPLVGVGVGVLTVAGFVVLTGGLAPA